MIAASCLLLAVTGSTASAAPARAGLAANVGIPAPLRAAAERSSAADRALVADAKTLVACIDTNRAQPARCHATRATVQQAGIELKQAERHLASVAATRKAHATASASSNRAPRLSVSGDQLRWTHVAHVKTYLLVRQMPGQASQYSLIDGTSTTPAPVPGTSVSYAVRTAANWSSWSGHKTVTYPWRHPSQPSSPTPPSSPPEVVDTQSAPTISVSGHTLTWNAIAGVSAYVVSSKVAGGTEKFTSVSGTSLTPEEIPGATVHYSVRTAVDGSAWSAEAAISYPASTPTPPPPHETPAPEERHEELPPPSAGFSPGIDEGVEALDFKANQTLGAKLARVEFGLGEAHLAEHVAAVAAQLAKTGTRLQPLVTFDGRIPSGAEAKALGAVAAAVPSVTHFEFGNETSFGYQYNDGYTNASYKERARRYAVLVKEADEAVAPYGDGILCQAEDGGSGSAVWVDEMFAAVPNLSAYVAGWVIHPYSNQTTAHGTDTYGIPKLERMVADLAAFGNTTTPIDVTEWGIASDNGPTLDNGVHMTYAEAGEALRADVPLLRKAAGSHPIDSFIVYQDRDQAEPGANTDHEGYFGALTHQGGAKGGYTEAVEKLMAE
ncbi:MAG: hypothetical protein ACLQBY_03120 [Solirubrobacteraceae bacterium]